MPNMEDPNERMAYYLSELDNDNAPIGWRRYLPMATSIVRKFDLAKAVMNAEIYVNPNTFQSG